MIKKVYEWLYENWLLSFLVLVCLIALLISGMMKICRYVVSTVEYPAYETYFFNTSEPYILIYENEGRGASIIDEMNIRNLGYDVEIVTQGKLPLKGGIYDR